MISVKQPNEDICLITIFVVEKVLRITLLFPKGGALYSFQVVACTLSSAGGELLTLSKGSPGFQAVIIDEVASFEIRVSGYGAMND